MAAIASGAAEDATLDQRITCAKEVASYVYPKRKAVDSSGSSDNVHRFAAFPGDDAI